MQRLQGYAEVKIVGMKYNYKSSNGQRLPNPPPGCPVSLQLEPTNPYHRNAIKVINDMDTRHLGYIVRETADILTMLLNDNNTFASARAFLCGTHNLDQEVISCQVLLFFTVPLEIIPPLPPQLRFHEGLSSPHFVLAGTPVDLTGYTLHDFDEYRAQCMARSTNTTDSPVHVRDSDATALLEPPQQSEVQVPTDEVVIIDHSKRFDGTMESDNPVSGPPTKVQTQLPDAEMNEIVCMKCKQKSRSSSFLCDQNRCPVLIHESCIGGGVVGHTCLFCLFLACRGERFRAKKYSGLYVALKSKYKEVRKSAIQFFGKETFMRLRELAGLDPLFLTKVKVPCNANMKCNTKEAREKEAVGTSTIIEKSASEEKEEKVVGHGKRRLPPRPSYDRACKKMKQASSLLWTSARKGSNGRKKGSGKGVNDQSELTTEKYRTPRDKNFTRQETELLIILVGDRFKARNNRNECNLNPTAEDWNYIGSQFNYRSAHINRHLQVLRNRWKTLKADFSFFKNLVSRSGHGWNEADGIPDVTPEAWEEYIKKDEKRYKPYRHKKFPWFRAMEELCGSNIATCDGQITTDPTIPITHNLDSDSSETGESSHESGQAIGNGNTANQTPQTSSPISSTSVPSVGTERGDVNSVAEKRKRGDTSRAEASRNSKKNAIYRKTEIVHTFLNQQQSRNETLDRMADNLQKNPKYGDVQKEVIDRLKTVLDSTLPTFHSDYYDMLAVLGNDWVRGCFINVADDMLRGYVDHILHRYRGGLPLIPNLGGSVLHYPSPNPHFMPNPYGMDNAPPHILHHVASQTPPMNASPVAYPRNMNNPLHTNVSGADHTTPCTPSSNPHPPSSHFYHPWT